MLVIPDGADFTSAAKSRSPRRQVKSAPPSARERNLGQSARAFSSTRLRSRQDFSASRSASAFQIPCLAWWISAADLRAIWARISSRVRPSNSSDIASPQASSVSLSRELIWSRSHDTGGLLGIIAANVIPRIAARKGESDGWLRARGLICDPCLAPSGTSRRPRI
jgi:hypothetical protein